MNNKILYFECNSGISGDMTVAALLDLGADLQVLKNALSSLPLTGYSIEIKEVFKSGIRACDFNVVLEKDNHDHDMDYLHGAGFSHSQNQGHNCAHEHTHNQKHNHGPGYIGEHTDYNKVTHEHNRPYDHGQTHEHEHKYNHDHDLTHTHNHHNARNLNDIIQIINAGTLTDRARDLAIRMFRIIARAEASVHGKSVEDVHFHEVGAIDSIVDIVSVAVCLDNLNADQVVVSPLTDGTGHIRCQHGIIPVPVPAVTAIAANEGLILKPSSIMGELVTPTGAAIAAAVATAERLPNHYRILKTGIGAGKRDYEVAGILRIMLLEAADASGYDTICSLETNIDDCSGEALSFTMEELMKAGALDAFFIPIYMKKNRPAVLLKVLCNPQDRRQMEEIIFRNTTSIGIRMQEMQRTKLKRRTFAVETPWGMSDVKCCTCREEKYFYPENDSVAALARQNGIGFPEMYHLIQAYVREHQTALL